MNPQLQTILDSMQNMTDLSESEKESLIKKIKEADKAQTLSQFKLDRLEKDRNTLTIMLQESIEDLQKKSRAIEEQNRELEIESSLEKVRTVAMGMRKRDDMLDICRIISEQLELLGIKEIRNVQTAIFYEHKGTYINYEYYRLHDEALVTEVDYTNDEMSIEFAAQMTKGADEVFVRRLEGKEVKDWLNIQKTTNVFIDTNLENAKSLTYYWFSLGPVAIGMSAYDPLSEEEIALFKRFRNVFDLAYRRYLDIEKAEAQAREAQIEAALEKVRSRSLAMHKSDELQEVVHAVFERLNELNFELDTAIIIIFTEGSKDTVWWLQNSANQQYLRIAVDYADILYLRNLFEAKANEKDLPPAFYSFEQKNELLNYLFDHTDFRFTPPEQKDFLLQKEWATMSAAIAKNTAIHITRYSKKSFSEKEDEILKKFSNVFEQAYTRFLDLQKAEAQAREAQIQLALERVRARTMAMQKSDELPQAANLLFQQIQSLGMHAWSAGYCIWDEDKKAITLWMSSEGVIQQALRMPLTEDVYLMHFREAYERGESFWVEAVGGKELKSHYDYLRTLPGLKESLDDIEAAGFPAPTFQIFHLAYFTQGFLLFITYEPVPESHDIFKRFAKVFEQTYTRFLDLQKAEAQARESQIQLALERVRARTMAMQRSEELSEAVYVLFQQFRDLGENPDQATIGIINEEKQVIEYWVTMYGNQMDRVFKFPFDEPHVTNKIYEAWRGRNKSLVIELSGKDLYEFTTYRESMGGARHNPEEERRIINVAFFSKGLLNVQSNQTRSDESIRLLERFAAVFDQTYTRFLDLQKAEAQARESQIQLALERVRARTMAMQKSDELADVAELLFKQVNDLGIKTWTTGFNVWSEDNNFYTDYITNPQGGFMPPYTIDTAKLPVTIEVSNAKKRGDDFLVNYEEGESLAETYRQLTEFGEKQFKSILESGFEFPSHQYEHFVFGSKVSLMFITYDPVPEAHDIFKRFGKVFEQTYTRFLDLQKAEGQAREAKIEAALERTRTQSMIMQHSKELDITLRVFHEQVLLLGIHSAFSFLWLPDEEKDRHIFWAAWAENNLKDFKSKAINYPLDRNEPATKQCLVDWKSNQPVVSYHVPPAGVESYFAAWQELIIGVEELKPENFGDGLYYVEAFMKYGCFGVMIKSDLSEDEKKILHRFTIEFERTYTRFLDLQKAEAQAREAQIEAALERVRARAMAMHKSEELNEVANEMRKQLGLLGQNELETCAIHLYDESPDHFQSWAALLSPNMRGEVIQTQSQFPKRGVKIIEEMLGCYARHEQDYVLINDGAKAQEFLEMIKQRAPAVSEVVEKSMNEQGPEDKRAYWSVADFAGGSLVMTTMVEPGENSRALLRRFANVFGLAYRRFVDLKKAEAQAKESQIETALERVRSRTLAMQRSDELAETAAVLFRQLILLGIEPNRLYITIIKEETGEAEFWITDEDGSKISMAYTANMNANPSFKKMYDGWKAQNKSLMIDMHGKELEEYFKHLSSLHVPFKGGLSQKRRLQNIAYFSKGFIGMASPDEQPEATIQLLERFAAVFNLTFTRFNDLKIAEAHALQAEQDLIEIKAAKKKAEDTLTELQATQKQLVQSEKMASLGELTAGIAHEIQNPLNFVNNFSDVSNELLEEMKTELEKGNTKDAIAIVGDVKQNLEKILHHGKRADAIVKGMLQHSRTSSSQKELTDINVLADEYLRLAYHGLRAKDKSFNAKFITDFDKNVGEVNVIPQEIGRVILNLINNAFYAVSEKQKQLNGQFEPTVSVSTKNADGKVLIAITDNGGGIPQKNLDKIFQPFFTTKPTGQGTGLGLSLAYDIITKGHNGEMKVETQEGEGSKFIVIIPSTQ